MRVFIVSNLDYLILKKKKKNHKNNLWSLLGKKKEEYPCKSNSIFIDINFHLST